MEENNFDEKVFEDGYTLEKLAMFEEKYKISINIYNIGKMDLRKRNNIIVRFITVIRTLRRRWILVLFGMKRMNISFW
jgi:hypothetical protein